MADHTDDEIQLSADYLVEFTDTAINLTGIPDDQYRSVDENGEPATETETLSTPLIEFHDIAINLTGIPDDEFVPLDDHGDGSPIAPPGANRAATPPVPPPAPPKSV
jgi:hypothetical protein